MLEYLMDSLKVESTDKLFQHEQLIPEHLNKLKLALIASKKLIDPLIVDRKTKVILDGNHRKKALQLLRFKLAVCQEVDYQSDRISLGTWFPVAKMSVKEVEDLLPNAEKVDFDTGLKEIRRLRAIFMLGKGKDYFIMPSRERTLESVLEGQAIILRKINGRNIEYVADDLAGSYVEDNVVFHRRIIQKKEVIENAKKGVLFPPKSTRHIVKDRIIKLEVPLEWLKATVKEAGGLVKKLIFERYRTKHVRYYAEPVVVMNY